MGFESSFVDEAAVDVVFEVSESEGYSAEVFDATIDGFGWAVTAAWVGEVGQDVIPSAFQGSG